MTGHSEEIHLVKNFREICSRGHVGLRRNLLEIIQAGVRAGDPGTGTRRQIRLEGDVLTVGGQIFSLRKIDRIFVVGAGKGSFPIAEVLEEILGTLISAGVVVVKKGERRQLKRIEIHEASHPIPDDSSVIGAQKILEIVHQAGERDIVFAAVTGGSSALVTLPPDGITLEDIQKLNDLLLKSGAVIREMNIVRKHLCRIKGGRLVASIQPAQALTFTLDTAPEGMPWPDMCLADPSTFQEAISVLQHYDLWNSVSDSIRNYLLEGRNRPEWETVKSLAGMRARIFSVGDPPRMCQAAAEHAQKLGFQPLILSTRLDGEAREAGIFMAGVASEVLRYGRPISSPCALISGGETTVTIRGECGSGGPNQEFVLGFAHKMRGAGIYACASIDSDGTDGPTEIAGGIVDHLTLAEAERERVDIGQALKTHNSSEALTRIGGAIRTGHTGTNLQNLRVVLVPQQEARR
jgi:glycerate 2-kinase